MSLVRVMARAQGAYARRMARWFGRRPFSLQVRRPIVSFTFDDFPQSALAAGGSLLAEQGLRGTYYVATALAGRTIETGRMFEPADLVRAVAEGHELGCHTAEHFPAWATPPDDYLASVERNVHALGRLTPPVRPATHSYPISYPRPASKRRLARRFRACRFGGQEANRGLVDLNALNSFFLEQSVHDFAAIERRIAGLAAVPGWLIFSTHDVAPQPTRYGCSPEFFARVVRCVREAGVAVLTVNAALDELGVPPLGSVTAGDSLATAATDDGKPDSDS